MKKHAQKLKGLYFKKLTDTTINSAFLYGGRARQQDLLSSLTVSHFSNV